jgi:hypothetical protein
MSTRSEFPDGGFAFLRGVFPYSQGVVALDGFAIERVRFARPVGLTEGFRRVADHLERRGRPRTAFCACELRSPRPFSFEGFADFNRGYVAVLEEWRLFRDGINPVARSNVAPVVDPPAEPSFHAFSYTVPSAGSAPSFVVAGSGEWPEGGRFPQDIVARGDPSDAGMRAKAKCVLDTMERRMRGLGNFTWQDATAVQVYSAFALPIDEIASRAGSALQWNYCRPPIEGLDFEMDVRRVWAEHTLPDFP